MKKIFALTFLIVAMSACLQNDYPLPYVKGEIVKFSVKGQKEAAVIDNTNGIISFEVDDTVDLAKCEVKELELSDVRAVAPFGIGSTLDLTSEYSFDVETFQKYPFVIKAKQVIDRKIVVENQVGKSSINLNNKIVLVQVSSTQNLADMTVLEAQLGPSNATMQPDLMKVKDFSGPIEVTVTYRDVVEKWIIIVTPSVSNVSTGDVEAWGTFAYLNGSAKSGQDEPQFEYKKQGASEWTTVKAEVKGGTISYKLAGLTPSTGYVFRAKLGDEVGDEKSFTTEATPTLENMNFDAWSQNATKWYPNATAANSFWSTGNEGVVSAGKNSITTPVEGADAVKGKAARLETIGGVMLSKIAAGSLFTGTYSPGLPTEFEKMKKLVTFGRPYTGRPTKLKGWFKYAPKPVDIAADPAFQFPDSMGKADWCHIYVKLENWGDADKRPTTVQQIAYGEFKTNKLVTTYQEFEFEIKYSDKKTKPTHIVLTATSSVNGGDFCGGTGSVLFVDEFKFGFD